MTRTRTPVAAGLAMMTWLWAVVALAQPEPESIQLRTADELTLTAHWYPHVGSGGAPAVVLIHNQGWSQHAWQPMVLELHEAGFQVLTLDLRGHGESREATEEAYQSIRRRDNEPFHAMIHDVEAAVRWLTDTGKLPPERIALLGGAYGGNLAVWAGARNKKLGAVIAVSPSKYFFADPLVDHARDYASRPLFIIITKQYLGHGATEIQKLNEDNANFQLKVFPRVDLQGIELQNLNWNIEGLTIDWLKKIMDLPSS
jgi:pimeloyl-ACP methyl ester carboxylesterase